MQHNRVAHRCGGPAKIGSGKTGQVFPKATFRQHKSSWQFRWSLVIITYTGSKLGSEPVSTGVKGLKEGAMILARAIVKIVPRFKSNSLNLC